MKRFALLASALLAVSVIPVGVEWLRVRGAARRAGSLPRAERQNL